MNTRRYKWLSYFLALIITLTSFFTTFGQIMAEEMPVETEAVPENLGTKVPYKFDVHWSSAISAGVKDYRYENDDRSKIFITPTNNAPKTVNWSVNFGFNYENENLQLPEGSVKITVPSHLFENWNIAGNKENVNVDLYERSLPVMNWQFPQAPNTSNVTDFNYVDNGDGTFTLTNYKELSSKFTLDFQQSFTFIPAYVKVDENSTLDKDYEIKVAVDMNKDGVNELEDSKNLALSYTSKLNKGNLALTTKLSKNEEGRGFLSWQKSWGEKPADDDGKSYFYVVWFADYERGINSTLPFTSTIIDTGSKEDTNGEVIGTGYYTWHDNSFKTYLDRDYTNLATFKDPKAYRQYGNGIIADGVLPGQSKFRVLNMQPRISQAILKRYPVSLLKNKSAKELSTTGIPLSNSVRVEEVADNGQKHVLTAENTENILLNIGEGNLGKYNATSRVSNVMNGRYLLLNDIPTRLATTWDGRGYTWNTVAHVNKKNDDASYNFKINEGAPVYISGIEKDIANKNLNELKNEGKLIKLNDEDYSIVGFDIKLNEYEASETVLGNDKGDEITDYSTTSPIEIWVRKQNETGFTHYANVKKENSSRYSVTDVSGNMIDKTINNSTRKLYPLPENIVEIEYRHESKNFHNIVEPFNSVVLKPTENVKNLLNASIEKNEESYITSFSDLYIGDEKVDDTKGQFRKFTLYNLKDLSVQTILRKNSSNLTDIKEEGRQKLRVSIDIRNSVFGVSKNISGIGQTDSDILKKFIFNKGKFYDLLPKGTYVDEDTYELNLTWTYNNGSPYVVPKENYTVKFIENYENTGMTMMVVDYNIPDELLKVDMDSIVFFHYDLYNNYDNIIDRGADVINSVAFVNGNGDVPINPYGNTRNTDKMTFKDEYSSLYEANTNKSSFTESLLNYNAVTVSQSGFSKTSSADAKLGYNKNSTVKESGNYSYRLRFTQARETKSNNIVFYDVLENGSVEKESQWKGKLISVDVTSLESKADAINKNETLKPVVYYSLVVPSEDEFDLTLDNIWTSEKPDDLTKVKAIAVDATKTNKGNKFTLDNGSSLSVFINMQAPSDISLNNKKTVNFGAVKAKNYYSGSDTANDKGRLLVDDASVDLKIPTVSLNVRKNWEGISDKNIKNIQVTAKLFKNNVETNETILLNYENNFSGTFDNLKKYDYDEGIEKENVYTVKEINDFGMAVEEDGFIVIEGREFSVNYNKGIITNSLVNSLIQIVGSKTWEDGNNQDGIRPEEIVVSLYENGKNLIKSVAVSAETEWKYTFDELPTYDSDGNLITYTIMENVVAGYTSVINNYDITNKHTPEAIEVNVAKRWVGREGVKATINLIKDGEKVDSVDLDKDKGWKHTFVNLPKYKDGKEITYSIEEEHVPGYTTEIIGSAEKGFEIVNTYSPVATSFETKIKKIVEGKKSVDDEFKFILSSKNGENTIQVDELLIKGSGEGIFNKIEYNMPGKYVYEIIEQKGESKKITYDDSKYVLIIEVEEKEGKLEAIPTVLKDGNKVDEIVFINKYKNKKEKGVNTSDDNNLHLIILLMIFSIIASIKLKREI